MGFVKNNNKYGLEVFITNKGMETLFNGGLKNSALYFTLGSSEADYRSYMTSDDTPLEFIAVNGDFINGYYVNPDTGDQVSIIDNNLTRITGKIQNGTNYDKQIFRTSESSLSEVILYQPDSDTHQTYTFDSFKENTDASNHKFFNLGLYGYPNYPVIIGGQNMWSTLATTGLKHQEDKVIGYITTNEPTSLSNLIAKTATYPFPGVGVSGPDHAKTEYQKFQILNKSSQPIYLYDYSITEMKGSKSHKISKIELLQDIDPLYYLVEYTIVWNDLIGVEREDGKLRIKADKDFLTKNKGVILPFETINFWVQYEVSKNINGEYDSAQHYHGQSSDNKNKREGQLSFNFQISGSKTKIVNNAIPTTDNLLTTNIGLIIQVKDDTKEISGLNKITCKYYNGIGSPCDDNQYTTVVVYAVNAETITQAYALNDPLHARRLQTSKLANPGYYVDENQTKPHDVYYWDGTTFISGKHYACEIYYELNVYYSPSNNNLGDFSTYTPKTIYISGNNTTLESLATNNTKTVYGNNFNKEIIPNGYYVTERTKPTQVYAFNGVNATSVWLKNEITAPTSIQMYYKSPNSGDYCDTRSGYAIVTIYQNPQGQVNGTKYYTDVNNTILANYGYYVNKSDYENGRPFNVYDFEGDPILTPSYVCSPLAQISNVRFSSAPDGTFAASTAWRSLSTIDTIKMAFEANSLLFTTADASVLVSTGYYINGTTSTPVTPYVAYQFDKTQEKWLSAVDVLTPVTVYYYSGSEPRDSYTEYTPITVFLDKTATSIGNALSATTKTIYSNNSGTQAVNDGYYTAIDPRSGHSFTFYQFTGGVKSGPFRKLEQVSPNIGLNIYHTAADANGCNGIYAVSQPIYAYLEGKTPVLQALFNNAEPNSDNIYALHISLYSDKMGTVLAPQGYYAVPKDPYGYVYGTPDYIDGNGSFIGGYTWYRNTVVTTHQYLTGYYTCQAIVAPYRIRVAANNTNNELYSLHFYATNTYDVTISLTDGQVTNGMYIGMEITLTNAGQFNGIWTVKDLTVDTIVFTYKSKVTINQYIYATITINDACYWVGYDIVDIYTTVDGLTLKELYEANLPTYYDKYGDNPIIHDTYFIDTESLNQLSAGAAYHAYFYNASINAWAQNSDAVIYCDNGAVSATTENILIKSYSRTSAYETLDIDGQYVQGANYLGPMSAVYLSNDVNGSETDLLNVNNAFVYGGELNYYQNDVILKYQAQLRDTGPKKTLSDLYTNGIPLITYDGTVAPTGVYRQKFDGISQWYFWDRNAYEATAQGKDGWLNNPGPDSGIHSL